MPSGASGRTNGAIPEVISAVAFASALPAFKAFGGRPPPTSLAQAIALYGGGRVVVTTLEAPPDPKDAQASM